MLGTAYRTEGDAVPALARLGGVDAMSRETVWQSRDARERCIRQVQHEALIGRSQTNPELSAPKLTCWFLSRFILRSRSAGYLSTAFRFYSLMQTIKCVVSGISQPSRAQTRSESSSRVRTAVLTVSLIVFGFASRAIGRR